MGSRTGVEEGVRAYCCLRCSTGSEGCRGSNVRLSGLSGVARPWIVRADGGEGQWRRLAREKTADRCSCRSTAAARHRRAGGESWKTRPTLQPAHGSGCSRRGTMLVAVIHSTIHRKTQDALLLLLLL